MRRRLTLWPSQSSNATHSHGNDNYGKSSPVRVAGKGVPYAAGLSEAPFIVENWCVLYVPIRGHHSQLLHTGHQPLVG